MGGGEGEVVFVAVVVDGVGTDGVEGEGVRGGGVVEGGVGEGVEGVDGGVESGEGVGIVVVEAVVVGEVNGELGEAAVDALALDEAVGELRVDGVIEEEGGDAVGKSSRDSPGRRWRYFSRRSLLKGRSASVVRRSILASPGELASGAVEGLPDFIHEQQGELHGVEPLGIGHEGDALF